MKAVHLEAEKISVREVVAPQRPPRYALIRMQLAGICNTDLELLRGYYGFSGIPGHEFVGEVVDSDENSLLGKRVAGEINLACGHCGLCAQGLSRHCADRTVLGIVKHPGAFAEYLTLPDRNLHVVPDEIPSEHAVFIEPLAAACEILDQIQFVAGQQIAVLGDGKLGLLVAQVLQASGARVTLWGRHESKLAIVRNMGVEVSTAEDRPRAAFSVVVESTGSARGLEQAVRMVKPRGTIVMKSTVHGEVSIDTAPIIVNEITLVGSRCGRFEPAIEMLRSKRVDVSGMVAAEFSLVEAPAAFAEAARPGVLKVLLRN